MHTETGNRHQYAVRVRNARGRTTELLTTATDAETAAATVHGKWAENGSTGMSIEYVRPTGHTY
ncbi:hypothetical protein ACWGIR_22730 [Streptomyces albidoflavus]